MLMWKEAYQLSVLNKTVQKSVCQWIWAFWKPIFQDYFLGAFLMFLHIWIQHQILDFFSLTMSIFSEKIKLLIEAIVCNSVMNSEIRKIIDWHLVFGSWIKVPIPIHTSMNFKSYWTLLSSLNLSPLGSDFWVLLCLTDHLQGQVWLGILMLQ
jgi:hypothetical protein